MFFKKKLEKAPPVPTGKAPPAPPDKAPPAPPVMTAPDPPRPEWDLRTVAQQLRELAPVLETKEIEPALVQARLADHYRDLNLEPLAPSQFELIAHGLDAESWRRLALAVGMLDHEATRFTLAVLTTPVSQQVQVGFVGTARQIDALTLSLLRQSEVRIEEFARHLAFHLGVFWQGESAEQSKQRLHQLDYRRLLAEAEEAKKQAEERMEYLRKKQEEEAARRRRRGKQ
jgi:hypothetical protein